MKREFSCLCAARGDDYADSAALRVTVFDYILKNER